MIKSSSAFSEIPSPGPITITSAQAIIEGKSSSKSYAANKASGSNVCIISRFLWQSVP